MIGTPLILAVETSGRIGSVVIAVGEQILGEAVFSGPMKHSAEIFPAVCTLLDRFGRKPKDIEHIYISVGPGSFTGLRIAVTMAKTIHLANAVKIVAVDTLDVIAANVTRLVTEKKINYEPNPATKTPPIEKIVTILDAKRGRFFVAVYQNEQGRWTKLLPDCLMSATQLLEQFANKTKPIWLLGEGLVYYKDKFKANGVEFLDERYWSPRAEKVYLLGYETALAGHFADVPTLRPEYLTVLWL